MKYLKNLIFTILLSISLLLNISLVVFMNGYFKFIGTSKDVVKTVNGDVKWTWMFHWNVLEKKLENSYIALSKKLWGKYYFDNSSKNKIVIKKIYYLDGQTVKAFVTFVDGSKKMFNKVKFDSIVEKKQYIKNVEIYVINGKPLSWSIIFQWSELGTNVDERITILE